MELYRLRVSHSFSLQAEDVRKSVVWLASLRAREHGVGSSSDVKAQGPADPSHPAQTVMPSDLTSSAFLLSFGP